MKRIIRIEPVKKQETEKLRAAAYCRVSTNMADQLESLSEQKLHFEKVLEKNPDWINAGIYYDEGISGTKKDKRPGLMRMLGDCRSGKIDLILTKSISRFSRNTVDCLEMVRELAQYGVSVFFEKENIDTGKMEGELLLSILSSLAESESHSISGNSKWSIQKRFLNGTYKIGYTPYGYDNVDGKMTINREQAETVRWIFQSVLSGVSPGAVAKQLNEKGIPTKRDGKWTGSTVTGMIRNEKYTGDVMLQKTYTDDRFNRHVNKGKCARYYVKDHHEAIISREDFDAANALIDFNGLEKGIHRDTDKYQNRNAMSGKIICSECGSTWKRVRLSGYFGFSCTKHLKDKNACSMKSIAEEPVKGAFVTLMNKLTFGRDIVLLPYTKMLKINGSAGNIERLAMLEEQIEDNTERRSQILEFFTKSLLDPATYAKERNALDMEADRLTAERDSLTSQMTGSHDYQDELDRLLKYTAERITLTEFDDDLFTEHVDHIVVYKRTEIGFAMKCGPVFRERI